MNAPAPLLVCFATPDEARPFRALAPVLGGVEILLVGVGAANATRALEAALFKAGQDSVEPGSVAPDERGSTESRPTARFAAVINAGFAGGLDPRLKSGALLCESADARLLRAARAAECEPARIANSERILITPAEKSALRGVTGAAAVDMEAAALAAVCARAGVPFLNLRVISDAADEVLPLDFNRCCTPDLQLRISRVLLELVKSPGALPRLLTFHGTVRRCATALARTLTSVIASLRADP